MALSLIVFGLYLYIHTRLEGCLLARYISTAQKHLNLDKWRITFINLTDELSRFI